MELNANLTKQYHDIRTSYWFVPSLMVAASIGLAAVSLFIDTYIDLNSVTSWGWVVASEEAGARAMLTVIASAVIGIAGVAFSITMVAVSFASNQYGPRLIGNFMSDRHNQVTLGWLVGTFVYCIIILLSVSGGKDESALFERFIPHLSIWIALLLAITCVGAMIFFVHHIPESINVGNITTRLSEQLSASIVAYFPDHDSPGRTLKTSAWLEEHATGEPAKLLAECSGYIQTFEVQRLHQIAERADAHVQLIHRPGEFIDETSDVLFIWPADSATDEVRSDMRSCFSVGEYRTAHQNTFFIADQIVEVIARALSPGINDPFTAKACLDRLRAPMIHFATREEFPTSLVTQRIQTEPITFSAFAERVFGQARPFLSRDLVATLHAIDVLEGLTKTVPRSNQKGKLMDELEQLVASSQENLPQNEAVIVKERFEEISNRKAT